MVDPTPNPHRDLIARVTLPVIVAAFLIQPDVALMSAPERLTLLAVIILGLIMMEAAGYLVGVWRLVLVAIATALAMGMYTYVVADAQSDKLSNDKRCAAIQRDMLAAQPRRTDGPDLFQALGCRPQGEGSVFSKPTRLERAARRALPEGGRS
jgi:hypothetical protein